MDIVTYVLAKNSASSAIATAIAALPKGLVYRGAVSYVSDLPNNAEIGDCYTIKYKGTSGTTADGHEVAWGNYEGTPQWIDFGGGGGGTLNKTTETWTFVLADNTTVDKTIVTNVTLT